MKPPSLPGNFSDSALAPMPHLGRDWRLAAAYSACAECVHNLISACAGRSGCKSSGSIGFHIADCGAALLSKPGVTCRSVL